MKNIPELVCPAGNLPALKTAVDNGADTVYMGLKDATNARNFPGLNFDQKSIIEGIRYAHDRGRQVLMAINTYAQAGQVERWRRAVDTAADLGADAVIVADPAVMAYACEKHPNLRLHMSVQGSATNYEAINLMKDLFGIRRAVLPRVLTIDQVQHVIENTDVEIEVFGFGSLCVMVEGRCILSSYATGESPNMQGVCSPAKAVRWEQLPDKMNVRLNQVMIDQFNKDEPAGYPTLCKGRFEVNDETYYALEEPTSLNVLEVLPQLIKIGVAAVKVEGRCILSSYATGESPNMQGVCSPAKAVRWEQLPDKMNVRLNQVMIDQFNKDEPAGYPTLCKGRFEVNDETYYALEEPTSLNVLEVLPQLIKIGVAAVKVEGRQRSPMYTAQVTRTLRQALDAAASDPAHYRVTPAWDAALGKVSEGSQSTLGAYNRPWK